MNKCFEEEFEISTQKNLKFRFKKLSCLDVLAMSEDYVNYLANHNSIVYKNYMDSVFRATEVCIHDKWYPLKEGNNVYLPADIENDYKGLREILVKFLVLVINPVFQDSNESSNEQE